MDESSAAPTSVAPTFSGFGFRDNLASVGAIPAAAPYNFCPDVIRTGEVVADPQATFTAPASLATIYDPEPESGQTNYCYLRSLNVAVSGWQPTSTVTLSLYAAPAQLLPSPSTWTRLSTAAGQPTVSAQADPGQYAVPAEPFVWTPSPIAPGGYHCLVGQVGSSAPQVSSWQDAASLMSGELRLGITSVAVVSGTQSWERSIAFAIPATFTGPADLTLTATASGFDGCRLGIIASSFTATGQAVMLNPTTLQDGKTVGLQFSGEPGYEAIIYVQCWVGDATVAPGSTISLELSCLVSGPSLDEARARDLLDPALGHRVSVALGVQVGPQQVMPVGATNFLVGAAPG